MPLFFKIFANHSPLAYGLSEKSDGSMKVIGDWEHRQQMADNKKRFFKREEVSFARVVLAGLVHGVRVEPVTEDDAGQIVPQTDALVTKTTNLLLSLTVADCLPIFFYAPKSRAVGLAHAGWQGIVREIVPSVVASLKRHYGVEPNQILVGLGPGIQACHFEVRDDVLKYFTQYPAAITKREGKTFISLSQVVKEQLVEVGVLPQNIEINPDCTYCLADKYFSYRRDRPEILQTMVAYIGIKE